MKALLVCTLLYSAVVIAQENEGQSSIPAHCQHTSTVNSDVQIASLRFEEVKVPLILSLFILITLIAKLCEFVYLYNYIYFIYITISIYLYNYIYLSI